MTPHHGLSENAYKSCLRNIRASINAPVWSKQMSLFGRVFVIGLFIVSLVGWSFPVADAMKRMWKLRAQKRGLAFWRRKIAVALVVLSYVGLMLYRGLMGWKRTVGLVAVVSIGFYVVVCLISIISPKRVGPKLIDKTTKGISWLDEVEEDVAEGIITLFFFGFVAAWFAFLLFAPFGVLCATGLRECGSQ